MGVCDYSCFFHGGDGEQCLCTHEDCAYSEDEDTLFEIDDTTDILLSEKATSTHHTGKAGSSYAYLLMFTLPGSSKFKNTGAILQLIREKRASARVVVKDDYSWDAWNFDTYTGYIKYLLTEKKMTGNLTCSIWKPKRIDSQEKIVKLVDTWAINVCPLCAAFFLPGETAEEVPEIICSEYLRSIADKHDIPITTNSKIQLMSTFRQHFKFLVV